MLRVRAAHFIRITRKVRDLLYKMDIYNTSPSHDSFTGLGFGVWSTPTTLHFPAGGSEVGESLTDAASCRV